MPSEYIYQLLLSACVVLWTGDQEWIWQSKDSFGEILMLVRALSSAAVKLCVLSFNP